MLAQSTPILLHTEGLVKTEVISTVKRMNGFYLKSRWLKRDKILSTSWLWLHIARKKNDGLGSFQLYSWDANTLLTVVYPSKSLSSHLSSLLDVDKSLCNLEIRLLFLSLMKKYQNKRVWGWTENRNQSETENSLNRFHIIPEYNPTFDSMGWCASFL